MRIAILPLALCAAACGASQSEREASVPSADTDTKPAAAQSETIAATTSPDMALPAPETIAGEYRVAGIDGKPVEGSQGIAVSIDARTIAYEPRCLGTVWAYSYGEGQITLDREPGYASEPNADGSSVSCLPAVTPAFHKLASALDAVTRVRRTPENGLAFTGGGRSATLFLQ